MHYTILADCLLAVHFLVPLFIVGGLAAIAAGGARGWRWIRNRRFRWTHAGLMLFVLAQSLMGRLCPLTHWEYALRQRGIADPGEPEGLVARILGRLLYHDFSPAQFVGLYALVALLIALAWWRVPPDF